MRFESSFHSLTHPAPAPAFAEPRAGRALPSVLRRTAVPGRADDRGEA